MTFVARVGLSISLVALVQRTIAQNLVPNWSFEDTGYCSVQVSSEILHAPPWFSANTATPDVYAMDVNNACGFAMDTADVIGQYCYQAPFEGARFAGEYVGRGQLREYMEVSLLSPLLAGHSYRVAMEISIPECWQYAVDYLGVYFAEDSVLDPTIPVPGALPVTPQAQFHDPGFFTDEVNWMHVEDTIVAMGGEQFIVIGSFADSASIHLLYVGGIGWASKAYYYFDGVVVEDVTHDASVPEHLDIMVMNGDVIVQWPGVSKIDEVLIMDLSGRSVFKERLIGAGNRMELRTAGKLCSGIYLITARSRTRQATAKWTKME